MSLLSRLSIGPRLFAAFACVLALMLALGSFAIYSIGKVNAATTEIATNWLVATRALGEYQNAVNRMRRAEANLVFTEGAAAIEREQKRFDAALKDSREAWARYVATVDTDEERALLAKLDSAAKGYADTQAEFRKLVTSGSADLAARQAYYQGRSREALQTFSEALAKQIEFQTTGANRAYESSQTHYAATVRWVMLLGGVALALGGGLAWAITRSVTGPLSRAVRIAEAVAEGDLTSRIQISSRDETGRLLAGLQRMNDRLEEIVRRVRDSSESIATGSAQIASGNADLSQRTEEQAANLEETAASMEELTATVQQNADTARRATQMADSAAGAAQQGGDVVQQVTSTMAAISNSSRRISDIIGVIDGIAFQTNILALNAAVEAARAGEQGRGFAVVAGEVRTLAQRSAQAAKEIKSLISESVNNVENGSRLVDSAGSAMSEIVDQVKRVSVLIHEISSSSQEQSNGIAQVGDAVAQLDQVTQQNAALVEQSAAAAESLKHQAAHLAQTVAVFQLR